MEKDPPAHRQTPIYFCWWLGSVQASHWPLSNSFLGAESSYLRSLKEMFRHSQLTSGSKPSKFPTPASPEGAGTGFSWPLSKQTFAILPSTGYHETERLSQSNGFPTWKWLWIIWRACKNTNHQAPAPEFLIQKIWSKAQIICSFNKFSSDADAAGPGTTFWQPLS